MFDIITDKKNSGIARPLDELRAYANKHRNALLNAAALLGGTNGARLACSAIERVNVDCGRSKATMRVMEDLLGLLTLEHVHDPSREEAAHFAAIDPASPRVEEICLLADGFNDALAIYRDGLASASAAFANTVAA